MSEDVNDVDGMCNLEAAAKSLEQARAKAKPQIVPGTETIDPEVEKMIEGLSDEPTPKKDSVFYMVQRGNPPKIVKCSSTKLPEGTRLQGADDIQQFSNLTLKSADLLNTAFTSHDVAEQCLKAYLAAKKN